VALQDRHQNWWTTPGGQVRRELEQRQPGGHGYLKGQTITVVGEVYGYQGENYNSTTSGWAARRLSTTGPSWSMPKGTRPPA